MRSFSEAVQLHPKWCRALSWSLALLRLGSVIDGVALHHWLSQSEAQCGTDLDRILVIGLYRTAFQRSLDKAHTAQCSRVDRCADPT
ncbi:Uncharacterised protein [Vibrio cholerae]|nr:Uncharacterised protein [Vibrio cholerae]